MRYHGQIFVSDDAADGILHEAGHALLATLAFGRRIVERVNTHECVLRHAPPNNRAALVVAAAGVAAERIGGAKSFGLSTIDLGHFNDVAKACQRHELLTFSEAVNLACKVIEANRRAFNEIVEWLIREGSADGSVIDFIMLQHRGEAVLLH
jgi:hypothetical protein